MTMRGTETGERLDGRGFQSEPRYNQFDPAYTLVRQFEEHPDSALTYEEIMQNRDSIQAYIYATYGPGGEGPKVKHVLYSPDTGNIRVLEFPFHDQNDERYWGLEALDTHVLSQPAIDGVHLFLAGASLDRYEQELDTLPIRGHIFDLPWRSVGVRDVQPKGLSI